MEKETGIVNDCPMGNVLSKDAGDGSSGTQCLRDICCHASNLVDTTLLETATLSQR